MVEYDRNPQRELESRNALRTCIVGIGGAGSNVLDRITLDRTVDANLICMHTDVRVLNHSMAPNKVQLGGDLMRGVGAGGDPDLGREAALYSREQIRQAVEGYDVIFICAGLGGGTGSGAAPVIAEIAKTTNALVLVTATMPFSFEGRRRLAQAEEALAQLQKRADALVLFENNRMGELILPKDGIQKAFSMADQLIAQSLRAVSTMVSVPGLVKLGLDDLTSALSTSNGRCLFGFGEARGQNRGNEALKRALKSPLIDQGRLLHQTKTLLVHIAGGESLTLVEVDTIMKQIGRHVPDQTHILFGVGVDAKLGESVAVTLMSSLGLAQLNAHAAAAPPADMLHYPASSAETTSASMATPSPTPVAAPTPAPAAATKAPAPMPPAPAPVSSAAETPEPIDLLFATEQVITPPSNKVTPPPAEPELFSETVLADEPAADEAAEETPAPVRSPYEAPAATTAIPPSSDEELFSEAETEDDSVTMQEELEILPRSPSTTPAPVASRHAERASTVTDAEYAPPPPPAPAPPVIAPKKTAAPTEQQAFRFTGDEDRPRFKDTEPALVQGEDLDVPTWMRLKRKLKK